MAPAGAPARALPAPDRRETERRPSRPERRPQRAPSRVARLSHRSLATRLIVFGVLVAVLGVGRVALSFAVVQKSLATDAVAGQVRAVQAGNQQLAEQASAMSSALTVRTIAQRKYHLIVAPYVQFITVRPQHPASRARH